MLIALWGLGTEGPLAAVRGALERRGLPHVLLDQADVLQMDAALTVGTAVEGFVRVRDRRVDLAAISALYVRPYDARRLRRVAEAGPDGAAHAARVDGLLSAWAEVTPALVVSRAHAMATNDSKPYQLGLIRRSGFLVPDTLLTTDPQAAREFWARHGEVIYKSASGIRSRVARLRPEHEARLDHVTACPTQFQQHVAGADHRVHVVGDEVFACEIRCGADDYRYPDGGAVEIVTCRLPDEIGERCRRLASALELPVAGVDLRRTPEGEWYCFEVNPAPAFTYYEAACGLPIADAIARLLASAPAPVVAPPPEPPLVSAIMPTADRRRFVPQAIRCFLRQDYPRTELVIVDDGADPVADVIPSDPRIRYLRLSAHATVGAKRNRACAEARGAVIAHWDDDDWHAPDRLRRQVDALRQSGADVCGLQNPLFYDVGSGAAWQYEYPAQAKFWLSGSTLCYTKDYWRAHPFPDVDVGEDAQFVWSGDPTRMTALADPAFHVGIIHDGNVSPKATQGPCWRPRPPDEIRRMIGDDWSFYAPIPPRPPTVLNKTALVAAAAGLGDILRVTPLIRVFATLGYAVDVLLAPDHPDTPRLLEGLPEIRRVLVAGPEGVGDTVYDVAAFTVWGERLRPGVRARQVLAFDAEQWRRDGDSACVQSLARAAGWQGPLPPPFARPSDRRFGLPPGTVALHPGCKPDWPWKRWHGFADLAALLPQVALVGLIGDLDTAGTYFAGGGAWPAHVRDFVGQLSLPDTAALLTECAAVVSNDSGLMHLGVALGRPTFGVFGITSPRREMIPAPNMMPVTKGLPCEPACRQGPWGRRDCDLHLQCLRTLTAQEVFDRVARFLPDQNATAKRPDVAVPAVVTSLEPLRVAYYGYVFDATGYGRAARAYLHALHRAGVRLSVVDLAGRGRAVRDPLVESRLTDAASARAGAPDFHLFHGVPPQWASLAAGLPNAIGMTVWETDTVPAPWRDALGRVLEVWLPCEHNVGVFRQGLPTPIFRLPHPVFSDALAEPPPAPEEFLGVARRDFLFYSLFEWQERKAPLELLQAYLNAFPEGGDPLLILKAGPGAAAEAGRALAEAQRRTGSAARVSLRCEEWTEAQVETLHRRGDCYVSLHRGEGWGYPLFDAAARGKAVVATGYSGPLDYLDPQRHRLIPYALGPVRQPYVYYNAQMRWAEPDVAAAAAQMEWVYAHQDQAAREAVEAAARLAPRFSLDAVGEAARRRLVELLRQTDPPRRQRLGPAEDRRPPVPIPGEWYDADYFETGRKSNWAGGYTWDGSARTFTDAATYLTETFREADSFLDIGCAQGFLVRALRARDKECWGFDHSAWAITHAQEDVRPYLQIAGVDDVRFHRQFDILVAMEVFDKLTEAQLAAFLTRARAWAGTALLATIPTLSDGDDAGLAAGDADLARVTLRTRAWWHDLFRRYGWRQDPLHRVVELRCRAHDLPTRMGWQVYVYAPGEPVRRRAGRRRKAAQVGVVMIAYNEPDSTARLFESARSGRHDLQFHLFLHSRHPATVAACERLAAGPNVCYRPYGVNRGLSRSWNEGVLDAYAAGADVVLVVNADIVFGEGDVDRLVETARNNGDRYLITCAGFRADGRPVATHGYSCFALNPLALETLGCFDENFFPIYCEDADYARRAMLAGLSEANCPDTQVGHAGSQAILSDPALRRQNQRTHGLNMEYYRRKWGGEIGGETFLRPFGNEAFNVFIAPDRRHAPYGPGCDRTDHNMIVR